MGDFNDPFMRNRDASVQGRGKVQNRANVLQLKLIGQSHPTGLTNNLLKLFEPRPPLEYKPPPEKRKCLSYSGMGQYVRNFAEPGEPEYSPPVQKGETRVQRRARIHELRLEKGAIKASEELQKYDPSNDPNMTGDPYKTLFVARLNHESTEQRIKREFETYGPIKRVSVMEHPHGVLQLLHFKLVRLITDKETNKPRGYAFIEYMHTRDMKAAYKQADGRKLDNRRVIVDVERGRTVPNWRPRRLGGGLGSTRVGGEDLNQRYSGREQQVTSGGPPRSEEPRSRDDRLVDREREKSRDKGRERDRERERSHERTHDRGGRDRDAREDRQHRDRDRNRDRGRDRDRDRHRGRERDRGRDYEQDRDHPRERERDYDRAGRGRERDYGNVEYVEQKHGWNREHDDVEPEHGQGGHERDRNLRDQEKYGRGHHEPTYDLDHYEGHIEGEPKQEDGMEADDDRYRNQFSRGGSEPGEAGHTGDRDYEYRRSERSLSREFDH
ncbi:U1 small nuclear ribonucleoprotein 70 kDa [Acorus calamus]|uniref:U1 small nuclear ribonucleoprotein 70 kDa n=1 Tax=Acorus calamus TaxID=4465 RepID=A0AAV9CR34_ACOCL|nr:U1 small nuclear ribonucleoprotein 70 kDa [Acorus calamus]